MQKRLQKKWQKEEFKKKREEEKDARVRTDKLYDLCPERGGRRASVPSKEAIN